MKVQIPGKTFPCNPYRHTMPARGWWSNKFKLTILDNPYYRTSAGSKLCSISGVIDK